MSEARRQQLEALLVKEGLGRIEPSATTIRQRPAEAPGDLSVAEKSMWFLDRVIDWPAVYHMPFLIELGQALTRPKLDDALRQLTRRHDALRTAFTERNGGPSRKIVEDASPEVVEIDLRGFAKQRLDDEIEQRTRDLVVHPFDLSQPPLWRVAWVQADHGDALILMIHHIIFDGWSLGILVRDIASLLDGRRLAAPADLDYADYAHWQRSWLCEEPALEHLEFWRQALHGAPVLEVPTDHSRPARQNFRGAMVPVKVADDAARALDSLARAEGATTFMATLAVWGSLLGRLSGQTDLLVATGSANRDRREIQTVIGLFANMVVLRLDTGVDDDGQAASLRGLLRRVKQLTHEAFGHHIPFETLVSTLQPERDPSRNPLFQVALTLEDATVIQGLPVRPLNTDSAKFDLSLDLKRVAGKDGVRLEGWLEYATALFDEATSQAIADRFSLLLTAAVAEPDRALDSFALMTNEERRRIDRWNSTATAFPRHRSIPELFADQAKRTPDAIAVEPVAGSSETADEVLTFAELAARSRQLARHLRQLGAAPEVAVAIALPRSVERVVAIMAVVESGGFFVPLDLEAPERRLEQVLEEAAARLLLTRRDVLERQPSFERLDLEIIDIERDRQAIAEQPATPVASGVQPDNLLYVMFTSGSTGRPKGVAACHRNVARLVLGNGFAAIAGETFLQLAPAAFDASTLEIWGPLLNGGRLVVFPPERASLEHLGAVIRDTGVTTMWLTAGLFHPMVDHQLDALLGLRQLLAGGDVLSLDHVRRFTEAAAGGATLINGYGPTEGTTFATCHAMPEPVQLAGSVPIGRPIADTRAHVLDPNLRPVPAGMVGELYLAGDGLARGYLGRPHLTAERFVPAPANLGEPGGSRLYRTGDQVRWRMDGDLEFFGRIDQQVKLRGFRIEPAEIEHALVQHPDLRAASVCLWRSDDGDKHLVAYVEPAAPGTSIEAFDANFLRDFLAEQLPPYMIPSAFVALAQMPLTKNGKLDRRALPAPTFGSSAELSQQDTPQNPTEELLAGLFAEILGIDQIGRRDNFFGLGGHSLAATRLASRLRQIFEVDIPIAVVFESPDFASLAERIDQARKASNSSLNVPLETVPFETIEAEQVPASFGQERLWFLDQLDPGSAVYIIPLAIDLAGPVDASRLGRALSLLVARHRALRTRFVAVDGKPWQQAVAPFEVELEAREVANDDEAERLASDLARTPFDLAAAPLWRAELLRLEGGGHRLLWMFHHSIVDGWSVDLLVAELADAHAALALGEAWNPDPDLPTQNADHAVWQRRWLDDAELGRQLDFWRRALADSMALDLPGDRPRPAVQSQVGGLLEQPLDEPTWSRIVALAQQLGATPFMVALAAFRALLFRITGEANFAIGTPVAGRRQRELEHTVDFCVNTLALATRAQANQPFAALVDAERRTALSAYSNQELPFERLVEELDPARDPSRSPIFQVMFVLREAPSTIERGGLRFAVSEIENGTTKVDLTLGIGLGDDGPPRLALQYCRALFDQETVAALAGRYVAVLEAIAENPHSSLASLPIHAAGEQAAVEGFSAGRQVPLPEVSLPELLAVRAAEDPQGIAVESHDGSQRFSRQQLVTRARCVANGLRLAGVAPEQRVGVLLERSPEQVLAFTGSTFAGTCYVPLDLDFPQDRLALLIEDAGADRIITCRRLLDRVPTHHANKTLLLEDLLATTSADSDTDSDSLEMPDPRQLAYIMYTSGSTGRPKGVAVEHRQIVQLARHADLELAGEVLLHVSPTAFDASTIEIWGALLTGERLVIHPPETPSFDSLAKLLAEREVTMVGLTTGLFHQMVEHRLEAFAGGCRVMTGGDVLSADLARRFTAEPDTGTLLNCYGPTETTVHIVRHAMTEPAEVGEVAALGRPIPNSAVWVLDASLRPVPVGVAGEIYLGGAGLSRGYFGRPAATAERFLPHPFGATPGARLYRSGDLGRWRRNGLLDFLGRADDQLKLRGFRIEPGEIRAALERRPEVAAAAVLARPDATGEKRLLAWVVAVPTAELDVSRLASALAGELPSFMLPAAISVIEEMPLTLQGKVDGSALPDPDPKAAAAGGGAPQGLTEELLAGIFADVLGIDHIERHDDFFALGGHSLRATQVVSRIARALSVEIPLRTLFEAPRLADLAAAIDALRQNTSQHSPPPSPSAGERPQHLPLTFGQERLWFLAKLDPMSVAYNIPAFVELRGDLDVDALAAALTGVIERHEVLRTTFRDTTAGIVQQVLPPAPLELQVIETEAGEYRQLATSQARQPFDLETDLPLRAVLYRLTESDHRLLLVFHHIASDWWSQGIFFGELQELYRALLEERQPALPELALQVADIAIWQRQHLADTVFDRQLDHWRQRLAGLRHLELPADRPPTRVQGHAGDSIDFHLDEPTTAALESLARSTGTTPFMVLLGVWQALLHHLTDQEDFAVGSPVAGRYHPELEGLIGFFLNTLVLRADLGGNPSFAELLQRIRHTTLDAHDHQDLPFERLVEALAPRRDLSTTPLFQVQFSYQNELPEAELPGLDAALEPFDLGMTKFPLSLAMGRGTKSFAGTLTYATERFERATVQRLVSAFCRLAEAVAQDADCALSGLPYADPKDATLIADWSAAPDAFERRSQSAHRVAELRSQTVLEQPAVIADGGHTVLDHRQLWQQARSLAWRLHELGAGPETIVGLALPRGRHLIPSMLACLGAGAAFLPLDVGHPSTRRRRLLEAADAVAVITSPGIDNDLAAELPVLTLEQDCGLAEGLGADDGDPGDGDPAAEGWPVAEPDARCLAYVISTSGSTGEPKGVMVEHRQLVDYAFGLEHRLGLEQGWSFALVSTPAADVGMTSIWGALATGGAVHVIDRATALDPEAFADLAHTHPFDVMKIVPSHLEALLSATRPAAVLPRRLLILGGEAARGDLLRRVNELAPRCRIVNHYGPTETTVGITTHELALDRQPPLGAAPIGSPLPNARLEVLAENGSRIGVGELGELLLGGPGVVRGYLGRPAATAERFVPDASGAEQGARLYRTGDQVRWRADGVLDFRGRRDHQVKIRGHRLELEEVEAALIASPSIEAAAAWIEGQADTERLVAAVVPATENAFVSAELRRELRNRLPEIMVPSRLLPIDAFPLDANGKLDRKAVRQLSGEDGREPQARGNSETGKPTGSTSRRLLAVWRQLLGTEEVGVNDNFFDLGGHSLLLIRLQRQLREQLGIDVAVVDLFAHPTVASLARFIDAMADGEDARAATFAEDSAPTQARSRRSKSQSRQSDTLAIVGMAARLPGAADLETFWHNLHGGVESLRRYSREEQLAAGVDPALVDHPNMVPVGGDLADVDRFDARLFGFRPREAAITDPQQRFFLECAWQALEDAAIDPRRFPGRIGVFAGSGRNSYFMHHIFRHPGLGDSVDSLEARIGNDKDYLASRAAYKLGLEGPAVAVQTACSTSLVAVHMARRSLLDGECDAVLTGGVRIHFPRATGYLYQEGGVVSPDGHCRAFDASAEGGVPSDGCGVVVMMRLDEAQDRGAPIRALLKGSAINNDGNAKVGYTAPGVNGQVRVIREALADAGLEPDTIDLIEAHGTGTRLGDPIEATALRRVFGDAPRSEPCLLASVKSNFGHLDTAAGVTGVIKTVLALEQGEVPPSLHFQTVNPETGLDGSTFRVATAPTPWPHQPDRPRRAGVSSFGIGGTNAHVVLEEAPEVAPAETIEDGAQLLVISARSKASLEGSCERLAAACQDSAFEDSAPGPSPLALADVAHTLGLGRQHLEERRVVVARDLRDAAVALRDPARRLSGRRPAAGAPGVVFLLSGQGSQHPNMGRHLYDTEPSFRADVDRAAEILRPQLDLDLRSLLFPAAEQHQTATEHLAQTAFTQPALFVMETALARFWQRWGVEPEALLGHSIGELVAAHLAGVWNLEDALYLVAERGRLMMEQPTGAMATVPLDEIEVEARLAAEPALAAAVAVAVVNAPGSTVVAGTEDAVEAFRDRLRSESIDAKRLRVSHAFHSPQMQPAADAFEHRVAEVTSHPPNLPIVSNVSGTWLSAADATSPAYWARQIRQPVRFAAGIATLIEEPARVFVEIGPGASLSGFVRRAERAAEAGPTIASLPRPSEAGDDDDHAAALVALGRVWLAGVDLDFAATASPERRFVRLPTYAFDRRRYWIDPFVPETTSGTTASIDPIVLGPADSPLAETSDDRPADLPNEYLPPSGEMEERLVAIWAELFGVHHIGVLDGFFDLGGDSLLATQLVTRIRDDLGAEITVGQLMTADNVKNLAALCQPNAELSTDDLDTMVRDLAELSVDELEQLIAQNGDSI